MSAARLPIAPLARLVLAEERAPRAATGEDGHRQGDRYLARRWGVHVRNVQRWHTRGVDVWWADRLACAVGLTPDLVWGDAYLDAVDRVCARVLAAEDQLTLDLPQALAS